MDTAVTLTPAQVARLATPYDAYGRKSKPWRLPALRGGGGIRSTGGDMLKLAAALLDPNSRLAPALKLMLAEQGDTGNPRVKQGLGFQVVRPEPGRELVVHDGGTGGFRSTLALEPARHSAVVVLTNSAAEPSTNDLGSRILIGTPVKPTPPLVPPPPPRSVHNEVTLPAAELGQVVGRYDFGNGIVFAVHRDGDHLVAQREGAVTGPVLPIFAEAPLKFFWKAVDAQVAFTTDESGKVIGATFTQAGQSLAGKRLD
jgi:D-alanyl-D-alanine-carboxypeptidase/D-alanyl-D-alanine-endopeptidase